MPIATGSRHFSLLHHLHGFAFFAWIGLYVAQPQLVRRGDIRVHREMDITSVALAGAMVPLGVGMAVTAAAARQAKDVALPFEFSLYNLVEIIVLVLVLVLAFGWAIYEASGGSSGIVG